MKKICLVFIALSLCADVVGAAPRVQSTSAIRQNSGRNENTVSRDTATQTIIPRATSTQKRQINARTAATKTTQNRSATRQSKTARSATSSLSRAATTSPRSETTYDSCRDAYFTCMDQFCATQNDTYRRCVCSSKLTDIKNQEKKLSQAADNLKNFENINIEAITKTAAEVNAMSRATEGEMSIRKDKTDSMASLDKISAVLNSTKNQALSNQGTLDVANTLKSVWLTSDFIIGTDIANLTGESLFNAVHAQCFDMLSQTCSASNLKMASAAYGMYVENDCSLLETNLKNKKAATNAAIAATRQKMQISRIDNYDAHNSMGINDCITKVREDITAKSACGEGYIHCLDFSGKYLNITTGEVIYSPEFYQIENQISLDGDVLTNKKNTTFVSMLNKKRSFAEKNLNLCQKNADDVWDEFLRQAIVEIYQNQQKRVRSVKNECLKVVNECYSEKADTLKNFSKDSLSTFVSNIELTEGMCAEKLNSCSNLYGGGPDGLAELITTMSNIMDLTIEQSCSQLLTSFTKKICSVSESDTKHSYPYGCRTYSPGERYYADIEECNKRSISTVVDSDILLDEDQESSNSIYLGRCSFGAQKRYTSCNIGFYLYRNDNNGECTRGDHCYATVGNNPTQCAACPKEHFCYGGTSAPQSTATQDSCGTYVGSFYHSLVRYALQNCTKTNKNTYILSESLLTEIDKIAQQVKFELSKSLSQECESFSGTWVDFEWLDDDKNGYHDKNNDQLLNIFYRNTGANKKWGYCKKKS